MTTITSASAATPTTTRVLPHLSVAASGLFLVILGALHVLKSELDPSWRMISEYEIGKHGWLMQTAFVILAAGTVATAVCVRPHVSGKAGKAGLLLLLVSAAGMTIGGLAVSDPITATQDEATVHGSLHGLGAMLGIPTFPVAAVLVTRALTRSSTWPGPRRRLQVSAVAASAGLAQMVVAMVLLVPANGGAFGPEAPIGWPNRLLMLGYVAWLLTVSTGRYTQERTPELRVTKART